MHALGAMVFGECVLWSRMPLRSVWRQAHILLTHAHWDHAGDVAPYRNAKIYIQGEEYRHMQATLAGGRTSFCTASICSRSQLRCSTLFMPQNSTPILRQ